MTNARTRKVELKDADLDFGALIDEASKGRKRIVLERDGQTVAVVLSPYEYEVLQLLERNREKAFEVVDNERQENTA